MIKSYLKLSYNAFALQNNIVLSEFFVNFAKKISSIKHKL